MNALQAWRSLLFVPAHVEKFVAAAHTRGADAYILDLEDSVPPERKGLARSMLAAGARQVSASGAAALVRINAEAGLRADDLAAAVEAGVAAIVLPKVDSAAQVQEIDAQLETLEGQHKRPVGSMRLIAQIEDVRALPQLDAVASNAPRLIGMSLGSEDFSASAGMAPIPETLFAPNQQIVFACRRHHIQPFGFPASIADYSDTVRFAHTVQLARQMGFVGALCVHPSQVPILNAGFAPNADEIANAQQLLAAYESARGAGQAAVSLNGKMIDPPVAARARALLARAAAFNLLS